MQIALFDMLKTCAEDAGVRVIVIAGRDAGSAPALTWTT
jgi:hypothetical protein